MSITDELREWFKDRIFMANGWQEIRDIADHIDAEHGETVAFCRLLEDAAKGHEDLDIFGTEYTALPVDADGVTIHVGDVMTDGEYTFTVNELAYRSNSWSICNEVGAAWAACDISHRHAPTVEDVLAEFAEKIIDSQTPGVHPTYEEAIAEYSAKLRLAGDAE